MIIKSYSELMQFESFNDRYEYLKVNGVVGKDTFGFDRYMNQTFYSSTEWHNIRDYIIVRDNGCDLGVEGYDIYGKILIHHLNQITSDDFKFQSKFLLNPEYLISTTFQTHNAIHYGNENSLVQPLVERLKNDTCPWRH